MYPGSFSLNLNRYWPVIFVLLMFGLLDFLLTILALKSGFFYEANYIPSLLISAGSIYFLLAIVIGKALWGLFLVFTGIKAAMVAACLAEALLLISNLYEIAAHYF